MFIFCPRRQKTNQKNAAREIGAGFTKKKAASRVFIRFNSPSPVSPNPIGLIK